VNSAYSSGGEYIDASQRRDCDRGGDGRRPVGALCHGHREIACGHLA
jgi:hypothetical protein